MTNPLPLLRALTFAADKHRYQRRKGVPPEQQDVPSKPGGSDRRTPYINHPIAVAELLAGAGGMTDEPLLLAAVLHDTVEDTQTTFEELEREFGADVAGLVRELTDDKSLDYQTRKRLQIEHAAHASARGKLLKIADKTCNLRDLVTHPPVGWDVARKQTYVEWSDAVVRNCRGGSAGLDAAFDAALAAARESLA
jgi:GTP diphosphokinase / guanosine-3',5'-bis(diphosphate) 3'-diphosphatase